MKTAEEWQDEFIKSNGWGLEVMSYNEEKAAIKQIQLDAWKQGMSDAMRIIEETAYVYDLNVTALYRAIEKTKHEKESL